MRSDRDRVPFVERTAVAEEVASVLRHDLRNKFASIRNAAFYLRRRTQKTDLFQTDPRMELFFKLIDDELIAAEKMISDHASFGERLGGPVAPTGLEAAVNAAVAEARVPEAIHIEQALGPTPAITADPVEMIILIRSLIDNAVEALPDRGTITVRTTEMNGAVIIEVADTGRRLEETERARAFQPFVSDKAGHLGIGLNIARRIAERYGGRLEIESHAEGTVARATFAMPVERTLIAADSP